MRPGDRAGAIPLSRICDPGPYLYNMICSKYPEFKEESKFDLKDYCMKELNYSKYIDRFDGSVDTLLIP